MVRRAKKVEDTHHNTRSQELCNVVTFANALLPFPKILTIEHTRVLFHYVCFKSVISMEPITISGCSYTQKYIKTHMCILKIKRKIHVLQIRTNNIAWIESYFHARPDTH